MQPALGFGVMARYLPNRWSVLTVTITTHLVFGFGLHVGLIASTATLSLVPQLP